MIFKGQGGVALEEGEPSLRSCWECNSSHEHLQRVNTLHACFECGRYWVFDRFLSEFADDAAIDAYFEGLGLAPGDSTTKIDRGYRVVGVTVLRRESP